MALTPRLELDDLSYLAAWMELWGDTMQNQPSFSLI